MDNKNPNNSNFIREIILEDIEAGRLTEGPSTRFPPEPNGYLHIGHAKSVLLNYGLAEEFKGSFTLRMDDTNPSKEEEEYAEAIIRDVAWLGADWGDRLRYASDYFEQMFGYAEKLILSGDAYVDDLSSEEIREYRGTLISSGKDSPYRLRTPKENLELFRKMRAGEFPDGSRVLRAKIDMASPNINMRDPVMYRILSEDHPRTKDAWKIYPMYDFAHCIEDSVEGITHSICTLEFENHRPLYDWFLEKLSIFHPRQIEFARLDLSYTLMSKRILSSIVESGLVDGWDDPRLPTIAGLRRRGYTPSSIKDFCSRIGVAKANSLIDMALLEHCIREELNKTAPRLMGVIDPVLLLIENYPGDKEEIFQAENNPEDSEAGFRNIKFTREVWVEREDFMEDPPKKFFRLAPGREVRLKHAYCVTCTGVEKDASGVIRKIIARYDPDTRGGDTPDGRRVKGTLHWVSAKDAVRAEVRLYERLLKDERPATDDPSEYLNPESLTVKKGCMLEPSLSEVKPGERVQFLRKGYFVSDINEHSLDRPVFNRIVPLRDSWAKVLKNNS